MTTMLLVGSLAVDVGYICALTGEAQNNADAGCLAGASALQEGAYEDFHERALTMLGRNQKSQGFTALRDQIIQVGRWDTKALSFTPVDPLDANRGNAVRVVSVRNKVPLFFAGLAGHHATDVTREAVAMVRPTCGGIWGLEEVRVPGNVVVDSYDSRDGAYSAMSAGENGDVCSNGDLSVAGSIEIHGDALGRPVTTSGGAYTITGFVDELGDPIDPPMVDFGDVALINDNGSIGLTDNGNDPFPAGPWDLFIKTDDNLTLAPGTYYLDSAEFGAVHGTKLPGSITLTGPTTIYVDGDFGATGQGAINTTGDPGNLTIISSGSKFSLTGQAEFYGSIIAPKSEVLLAGGGDMYGALIGGTVKIAGNFQFHVDESLDLVHSLKKPAILVK